MAKKKVTNFSFLIDIELEKSLKLYSKKLKISKESFIELAIKEKISNIDRVNKMLNNPNRIKGHLQVLYRDYETLLRLLKQQKPIDREAIKRLEIKIDSHNGFSIPKFKELKNQIDEFLE